MLSWSREKDGKRCGEIELLSGTIVFLWLNYVTVHVLHSEGEAYSKSAAFLSSGPDIWPEICWGLTKKTFRKKSTCPTPGPVACTWGPVLLEAAQKGITFCFPNPCHHLASGKLRAGLFLHLVSEN